MDFDTQKAIKAEIEAGAKLVAEQRGLLESFGTEDQGELTPEGQERFQKIESDYKESRSRLEKLRGLAEKEEAAAADADYLTRSAGRVADRTDPAETRSREDASGARGSEVRHYEVNGQKIPVADELRFAGSAEYRSAFQKHLAKRPLTESEQRALSVGTDAEGGHLVPIPVASELFKDMAELSVMRQISREIFAQSADGMVLPTVATKPNPSALQSEADDTVSNATEELDIDFGGPNLNPVTYRKVIKVSNRLLRANAGIDVESEVSSLMVEKVNEQEEQFALTGTGSSQPLGIFTASASGITTSQDYVAATNTDVSTADVIGFIHSLPAKYRQRQANTHVVATSTFTEKVRLIDDGNGRFLWMPSLALGMPETLAGIPFHEQPLAEPGTQGTIANDEYHAVVGDFSKYAFVSNLAVRVRVLPELYSTEGRTGYLFELESFSQPMIANAFRRYQTTV